MPILSIRRPPAQDTGRRAARCTPLPAAGPLQARRCRPAAAHARPAAPEAHAPSADVVREYPTGQAWQEQVKGLRELYRERRDAMLEVPRRG